MPAEEPLAALLDGALPPDAQAALEEALAADGERLRELLSQERLDAALRVLLGGTEAHARVKQAILAELSGGDSAAAKARLMGAIATPSIHTDRNSLRLAWLVLAAAACAMVAFIAWPRPAKPAVVTDAGDVQFTGDFPDLDSDTLAQLDAALPDTMPARRIPGMWPFAAESPWNTPVGSAAQFAPVEGVSLAELDFTFVERRIVLLRDTDPIVRVKLPDGRLEAVHLDERVVGGGMRGGFPLIAVNLRENMVIEIFGLRRPARHEATANAISRTSLLGPGFGGSAASAFGGSTLGGMIRSGELDRGIFHALALRLPADRLSGFTWPATTAPSVSGGGNVRIGTLLALPPDFVPESIAPPGTAANRIARALRDYGAYVVGVEKTGYAGLALDGLESHPGVPRELLTLLKVVANNSATTPGGGGERKQPAAPPWR